MSKIRMQCITCHKIITVSICPNCKGQNLVKMPDPNELIVEGILNGLKKGGK